MERMVGLGTELRRALAERRAVVALESAVVSHGLPPPRNLEAARRMSAAVREEGAVPAFIALLEGRPVVGLDGRALERLGGAGPVSKVGRSDLAPLIAAGATGGTTVAATACLAARAGIRVMATGGVGGVHRGGEVSLDISSDLVELSRTPVAVVCSGPKAVLDLPRTYQALETLGVPVVGYGTDALPAFWCEESGLRVRHRVDSPEAAALTLEAQWELGVGAVIFTVPPPTSASLPRAEVEGLLARAVDDAARAGVKGPGLTPFLLDRMAEFSGHRTVQTNLALLEQNARVAARIAVAYARRATERDL